LRGTNCFIIGSSDERVMIDAGDVPPINRFFIENLRKLLLEQRFRLKVSTFFSLKTILKSLRESLSDSRII